MTPRPASTTPPGDVLHARLALARELLRSQGWVSRHALTEAQGWSRRVVDAVLRQSRSDMGLVEHRVGNRRIYTLPGVDTPADLGPPARPRYTRAERLALARDMLLGEPGWLTRDAYVERTAPPRNAVQPELRLLRDQLDLVENEVGRVRVWTLPGRPAPDLPPQPQPKRPPESRRPGGKGIRARHRQMGVEAYELAAADVPWAEVAERVGYRSLHSAVDGARTAARRHGWPWPLKYTTRRR